MITMIICKLSMKKICHKATCSQTYANLLHRSQQNLCCKKHDITNDLGCTEYFNHINRS